MFFLIGIAIVLISIIVGYVESGGNLHLLFQPYELLMIGGTVFGVYIMISPQISISQVSRIFYKNEVYDKQNYSDLLICLYTLLTHIKHNGLLEVEKEIDDIYNSKLLTKYPSLLNRKFAIEFISSQLYLLSMGLDNSEKMRKFVGSEINAHNKDGEPLLNMLLLLSDLLPPCGIIVSILGIMNAMVSLDADPMVLGEHIAGALSGTMLGIALSYCLISPSYEKLAGIIDAEVDYLQTISEALVTYIDTKTPALAIEAARRTIPDKSRPHFFEVENLIHTLKD